MKMLRNTNRFFLVTLCRQHTRAGSTRSTAKHFCWSAFSALAAILFFVLSAQAQDRIIPPVGGPGGGEFVARCPPGQLLGGVELRVGDDVDAIRPLCRKPPVDAKKVLIRAYQYLVGEDDFGHGVYKSVPEHYESRTTYYVSDAT